jgi:hypothetical protein
MIANKKIVIVLAGLALLAGCKDMGTGPEATGTPGVEQPPPQQSTLTFSANILPVLQARGCTGCHGGSGGLFVGSVAQLLQGGNHGAAIVAGNGANSNIIKKLAATPPFGARMPQGGPYLSDSTIQVIKTWIDQGAKP